MLIIVGIYTCSLKLYSLFKSQYLLFKKASSGLIKDLSFFSLGVWERWFVFLDFSCLNHFAFYYIRTYLSQMNQFCQMRQVPANEQPVPFLIRIMSQVRIECNFGNGLWVLNDGGQIVMVGESSFIVLAGESINISHISPKWLNFIEIREKDGSNSIIPWWYVKETNYTP